MASTDGFSPARLRSFLASSGLPQQPRNLPKIDDQIESLQELSAQLQPILLLRAPHSRSYLPIN